MADAIIVVPPPSPSDTNPPLGAALIARVAARRGVALDVLDLNIRYINRFDILTPDAYPSVIGDHGKDKGRLALAARNLFDTCGLDQAEPLFAPSGADVVAGMHYSFDDIHAAIKKTMSGHGPWREWLEGELLTRLARTSRPRVFGVSIMGPSQVFLALVILALVKEIHPTSITVLGGSHITLLANEIRQDTRYHEYVDVFLPGHSEEEFVDLICAANRSDFDRDRPESLTRSHARSAREFEYIPLFEDSELREYPRAGLTLPLQFTRGCAYGRCTFCTYPAVEPGLTRFRAADARHAFEQLIADHAVRRFSLKDSLFTTPMLSEFADALICGPSLGQLSWSATTKVTRSLIPVASKLAASGLRTLELGVETIHRRGQRLIEKPAELADIEDVIAALVESGISVVINLIFGLPGETAAEAARQLAWFQRIQRDAPGMVRGSLNMLEIVRSSPLAAAPPPEVELHGVAPWAYCYAWNAPAWRNDFTPVLAQAEDG